MHNCVEINFFDLQKRKARWTENNDTYDKQNNYKKNNLFWDVTQCRFRCVDVWNEPTAAMFRTLHILLYSKDLNQMNF
jgi:hypothetical protein